MRSTESFEEKQALASALRILSLRDLSTAELTHRLLSRGFPEALAEETVSNLLKAGCLDDRRFARQWAEAAILNGRGFGPRLRHELARQRVPEDIAAEVLAQLSSEYDELETISTILARKFSGFTTSSATDREKRRVMQYLQRRGFSTAAIFQAFRMKEDIE